MTKPEDIVVHEIEVLDLRSVFPREDRTFTPWLSAPHNLARMSRALGFELELLETEASTGSFRTDILARRVEDDTRVVIENQFGRSDHDHLGKTLTYLAAHDAKTVIWVAEAFADEHRAAIAWLNDETGDDFGFYAVIPRLIRVGGSEPGLRFEIEAKPNRFLKHTKKSDRQIEEGILGIREQFWPMFLEAVDGDPVLGTAQTRYGGRLGYQWLIPPNAPTFGGREAHVLVYLQASTKGVHQLGYGVSSSQENDEQGREFGERVWAQATATMASKGVDAGTLPADQVRKSTSDYATIPADFSSVESMQALIERALAPIRILYAALS